MTRNRSGHPARRALLRAGRPAWLSRVRVRRNPAVVVWTAVIVFGISAGLTHGMMSGSASRGAVDPIPVAVHHVPPTFAALALPVRVAGPSASPPEALDGELQTDAGGPLEEPDAAELSVAESIPAGARLNVMTARVPHGGTVGGALGALGVDAATIHEVSTAMRPVFDFRHAHPDDFFALIQDDDQKVLSFEFRRGRRDIYRIERDDEDRLMAIHSEVPLERRAVRLGGVIERSLFDAIIELGERAELVHELADIFAWDFDFSTMTRPGDEFRLVYEKFYDREGFVRYGSILAAQYTAGTRDMTAVYFEDDDGYGDYFTPKGNSVRRTFLRAPVRYSRISSRYSKARLHPILKVHRPHRAVDYAAPPGAPVWAVADGEVIYKGWQGGLGRLIKIRHNNGYVSFYGHLSRYAERLHKGDRVQQKQVIGYVGSSGLSSGPHLHYQLQVRGRFVDPLKVRFPKGKPIPVASSERFEEIRKIRLDELNDTPPALVLEAAM